MDKNHRPEYETRSSFVPADYFELTPARPVEARRGSIGDMHPKTEGILESSLYVDDAIRSAQFYKKIFGFRVSSDLAPRGRSGSGYPPSIVVVQERWLADNRGAA